MKRTVQATVWAVFILLVLNARPVAAQSAEIPKVEVSFGYQVLFVPNETFPLGLNFDVAKSIGRSGLGFVAEAGFSHDEQNEPGITGTLRFVNFGAGFRVSGRANPRVTPFVQVLAGGVHTNADRTVAGVNISDSDTAFMLQPGGGLSIGAGGAWSAVVQADYRYAFFKEEGDSEFRIVVGARVSIR